MNFESRFMITFIKKNVQLKEIPAINFKPLPIAIIIKSFK